MEENGGYTWAYRATVHDAALVAQAVGIRRWGKEHEYVRRHEGLGRAGGDWFGLYMQEWAQPRCEDWKLTSKETQKKNSLSPVFHVQNKLQLNQST
ncbi:hypothetical protein E2562_036126 [Oryza meyeriana var. granulata]|uniref:Uncharacterized protein n=1 Tax=Oryza meyeriana var. granulata TaxID=110450 RepID=A0A6G1C9Z8_9ORYZ|nr:hypothetical protein E2562_036126 [Oryza meyeriana var. granulata]